MKIKINSLKKINDLNSKLAGVATITLNDSIMINNVKIIKYNNELFVTMPSVKMNNTYKDICHPTTIELRNEITNAVLNAYNNNIFESGSLEEFHITDMRIHKLDNGNCKAMINMLLNNSFAINYSYVIDNTKPTDKDLNISFSFQVNQNGVQYVTILTDSLKEEFLRKAWDKYKTTVIETI